MIPSIQNDLAKVCAAESATDGTNRTNGLQGVSLNPVWRDCPPICDLAQLPSFEDWKDAEAWNKRNGSLSIAKKWRCHYCGGWHYWVKAPAPAGDSSGGAREQKVPQEILELANAQVSPTEPNK